MAHPQDEKLTALFRGLVEKIDVARGEAYLHPKKKRAWEEWRAGRTQVAISREVGVTQVTVGRWIKDAAEVIAEHGLSEEATRKLYELQRQSKAHEKYVWELRGRVDLARRQRFMEAVEREREIGWQKQQHEVFEASSRQLEEAFQVRLVIQNLVERQMEAERCRDELVRKYPQFSEVLFGWRLPFW